MKDPEHETQRITEFVRNVFAQAGFRNAVIGVSGGVDSATSLFLAVRALGAENVYPVLLPHGALSTQSTLDAVAVVEKAGIPFTKITRIDIEPAVREITKSDTSMDRIRRGNIMARMRMIYLFDQAKKRAALVVGTENRSEHLLGYYTRYGDEASDVEPVIHLYKTEVYALAQHLGVPQQVISKPPSADLWAGQTDENELGASYGEIDRIIQDEHANNISKETLLRVRAMVRANDFKQKTPYCMRREA